MPKGLSCRPLADRREFHRNIADAPRIVSGLDDLAYPVLKQRRRRWQFGFS